MKKKLLLIMLLTILFNSFFSVTGFSQSSCSDGYNQHPISQPPMETYFLHLLDYPEDAEPSWGDGGMEPQGIAHDDDYWYITASGSGNIFNCCNCVITRSIRKSFLFKIPVSKRLDQDFRGDTSVKGVNQFEFPALATPDSIG